MSEDVGGYGSRHSRRVLRYLERSREDEAGFDRAQRETNPEREQIMRLVANAIRLPVVRSVLADMLHEAGVKEASMNFTPIDTIGVRNRDHAEAWYDGIFNRIRLSSTDEMPLARITSLLERELPVPTELLLETQLLVIHELCHSIAFNFYSSKDASNTRASIMGASGFGMSESIGRFPSRPEKSVRIRSLREDYVGFNEGVTDRLAEEMFLEVARRTGLHEEAERFLANIISKRSEDLHAYVIFKNQVDYICEQLGKENDVPKSAIWKEVRQAYMSNPESFWNKYDSDLSRIFGSDFLSELRTFGHQTTHAELGEFDSKYGIPSASDYASKRLLELNIKTV